MTRDFSLVQRHSLVSPSCALLGTGNSKANNAEDDGGGDGDDSDSDGNHGDDNDGDGGGDGSPVLRVHSVTGPALDVLPVLPVPSKSGFSNLAL